MGLGSAFLPFLQELRNISPANILPQGSIPLLSSLHRGKALCSHSWEHLAFQGFIEEELKSQKTTETEIVLSPCSIFCSSAEALGGKLHMEFDC